MTELERLPRHDQHRDDHGGGLLTVVSVGGLLYVPASKRFFAKPQPRGQG